jgi:hypothetical protein
MATFAKIIEDRILIPVVVPLPKGKFYDRHLYAYPRSFRWMKETVPTLVTGRWESAFTPREQLILRVKEWLSGDEIKDGPMFQAMRHPKGSDVWELKTDDIRLFGWMYQRKKIIIAAHGYADHYKEPTKIKDYADDVRAVMSARDALPLDGPKFVKGTFDDLV